MIILLMPISSTEFQKRSAIFRCSCKERGCISIRKGTLLEQARISLRRFILLFYTFLQSYTYSQGSTLVQYLQFISWISFAFKVQREVSLTESEGDGDSDDPITHAYNTLSTQTICNYYDHFKEAIGITKQFFTTCNIFIGFFFSEFYGGKLSTNWRRGLCCWNR